jgi:hypothetical protein
MFPVTSVSFRTGTGDAKNRKGNAKNCYLCKMHRVDVTSVSFRTGREMLRTATYVKCTELL